MHKINAKRNMRHRGKMTVSVDIFFCMLERDL